MVITLLRELEFPCKLVMLSFIGILFTGSSSAQTSPPSYLYVHPEFLSAKPDTTTENLSMDSTVNSILTTYGSIRYVQSFPGAKNATLANAFEIHASGDIEDLKLALETTNKFSSIEVAPYYTIDCANPEPPVNDLEVVNNTIDNWVLDMLQVNCAWTITKGDSNIAVAVADTEFDTAHVDLRGKITSVWGGSTAPSGCEHGTKVSGIITARTNNNIGIASIGYHTSVAGYKASFVTFDPDFGCFGVPWPAIWQAYLDGRRVINVSWGGLGFSPTPPSPPSDIPLAVKEMSDHGVVLTVSAGNSPDANQHFGYANIPGVINVSGVDRNNLHGPTNLARNTFVDICAPTMGVATTTPGGGYLNTIGLTSMAAPQVAATVGLMLSLKPCLSSSEIEHIIKASADTIADEATYHDSLGAGRLNVYNAVLMTSQFKHSISTNTTWTGTHSYGADIEVNSGATLTILDTVLMGCDNVIRVRPGGKLVVDGGYISALPQSDGFWQGILAEGQAHLPQTAANQATVEIKNGSVIANARFAITNGDLPFQWSNSGGILKCSNSIFLNNRKSLQFHAYKNFSTSGTLLGDASRIYNCTFIVDDNYNGDTMNYPFDCHASLWLVHGVQFAGCQFLNRHHYAYRCTGQGIRSFDAGYAVKPYCNGVASVSSPCSVPEVRSLFRGFSAGVEADGSSTNFFDVITIDKADFDTNSVGVQVRNVNNVSILRSKFGVGNGLPITPSACFQNIGIHTINSKQFRIEENVLKGRSNLSLNEVGIVTDFSAGYGSGNVIYKNFLDTLDLGCIALGANSKNAFIGYYSMHKIGLRYECNTFNNNDSDIIIAPAMMTQGGIATFQAPNSSSSVGNVFTSPASITNYGHYIFYRHNGGGTDPTNAKGLIIKSSIGTTNSCPSKINEYGIVLTSPDKSAIKSSLYSNISERTTLLSDYESLIDGGSTDELISFLGGSSEEEIIQTLTSLSPYISENIFRYIAENSLLSTENLVDVLVENPEVLRNSIFLDFLQYEIIAPIGDEERVELDDRATEFSSRTTKDQELASVQNAISLAANYLITDVKNDSLYADIDSVGAWLSAINELWADHELVAYHNARGEVSGARAVLASIPANFSLTDEDLAEYSADTTLWGIYFSLQAQNKGWTDMSESQISTINSIIGDVSGTSPSNEASAIASSLTRNWGTHCMNKPLYPDSKRASSSRTDPENKKDLDRTSRMLNNVVTAYPNPAKDHVMFDYNLKNTAGNLKVTITNVAGQTIHVIYLANRQGKTEWKIEDIPNGVYYFHLSNSKMKYGSGKIVVLK